MFGISFDELLVIIIIGVFFLNKKDMPEIAKIYRSFIKKFSSVKREVRSNLVSLHNDFISSIDEDSSHSKKNSLEDQKIHEDGFIIADDGKLHPSFDIEEFKRSKK